MSMHNSATFSVDQVRKSIASLPVLKRNHRQLPIEVRKLSVLSLSDAFIPFECQTNFAHNLLRAINSGKLRRDAAGYDGKLLDLGRTEAKKDRKVFSGFMPSSSVDNSSLSGALMGYPRMGKTRLIKRALLTVPQCESREGLAQQINWMRVACPVTPSIKSFCSLMFDQFADLLGKPEIREIFANYQAMSEKMPSQVGQLAQMHSLGCLVVDDIQNLRHANQSDRLGILSLLAELSTEAGVPVILVGTPAAYEMLQGEARNAALCTSYLSDVWYRHENNDGWKQFVRTLWRYQWTASETPITTEIEDEIYHACQGLTELAVKLYQQVQLSKLKEEELSGGSAAPISGIFIKQTAGQLFNHLQQHLDAIRSGDPARLSAYEDLKPMRSEAKRMQAESDEKENDKAKKEANPESGEDLESSIDRLAFDLRHKKRLTDVTEQLAKMLMANAKFKAERVEYELEACARNLKGGVAGDPVAFLIKIKQGVKEFEKRRNAQTGRAPRVYEGAIHDDGDMRLNKGGGGTLAKLARGIHATKTASG
ncbi:AAA family ATPase [Altererythrobacter confluentis]|uniref:AAA family ATPase n=1 Tax=Allopontixanthobacter confluentis TaxID=1849021 RepID=A0A6L7GFY7_9SPHN|nr:ATP-binding protein [Allopontixanthobacter confluentis]MXP13591.1 AAA family ATPase [Allopontixanthobacter confluentis]